MSIVAQLMISIGFTFCVIVILKQMYFLHHTDELGFSFKNRCSISTYDEGYEGVIADQLKQIPKITEVVDAKGMTGLIPLRSRMSAGLSSWDDKPYETEKMNIERMHVSPEYTAFYDFKLVAGEMLTAVDPDSLVLINESAVKAFAWHEPVGKRFSFSNSGGGYIVKGVISDIYNFAPTIAAKPTYYVQPSERNTGTSGGTVVLFKYKEGMWKSCKEKIEEMMIKDNIDISRVNIHNAEEEYSKFLKSENALLKLLSVVSAICVLICVFGFVSLVSLTCEERRKEIAVRKINGATSGNILSIFTKEYFLLLIIGAAIAFPAGYFIMQPWLEQYMKQTTIPVWIYLSILFAMALIIVLCVGWRVYKVSIENPAEVVKTE